MSTPNTFGGQPLIDPQSLLEDCLAKGLPTANWQGRATVAVCPTGRKPGTATFLMLRSRLAALNLLTDQDLCLSDFQKTVTLKRYSVLSAEAVVPGLPNDPATPYLVTAVDKRYHLDRSPFSKAYNVYDSSGVLISSTKNGTSAWTWATMFADLWSQLPSAIAGTAPTLPFTPGNQPESWQFWGSPSAWQALNDVLDRLCCVLVYDPTTDSFTIEQQGTTDAAGAAFESSAKGHLLWDGQPFASARTAQPSSVSVRFRRNPAPAAGSDPFYTVTVALTAAAGTVAGTTVLITDDLMAQAATGTPSNSAALATRAAERATDYHRSLIPAGKAQVRVWRGIWPSAIADLGANASGISFDDRGAGLGTGVLASALPRAILPEFDTLPVSSGGLSLITQNTDATARITATTEIDADKTSGVGFSASGTKNTLAGIPASPTQQGVITVHNQSVAGRKASYGDSAFPYQSGGWDSYGLTSHNDQFVGMRVGYFSVDSSSVLSSCAYGDQLLPIGYGQLLSVNGASAVIAENVSTPIYVAGVGPASYFLSYTNGNTKKGYLQYGGSVLGVGYVGTIANGYGLYGDMGSCFAVGRFGSDNGGKTTGVIRYGIDYNFSSGGYPLVQGGIITDVITVPPPSSTSPPVSSTSPPASPPVSPPPTSPISPPISPPIAVSPISPPVSPPTAPPVPPTITLPPPTSPPVSPPTVVSPPPIYPIRSPIKFPLVVDSATLSTANVNRVIFTTPNGTQYAMTVSDAGSVVLTPLVVISA